MATLNQKRVVKETYENLRKGKRIIKGKILNKAGYKKSIQKKPAIVYESKGVRKELKPILERLEKHRDKIMQAMDKKDLNKEQYKILGEELGRITHDIQLLNGGNTENLKVVIIPSEVAETFNIDATNNETSGSDKE